jgi:hypothetical protein
VKLLHPIFGDFGQLLIGDSLFFLLFSVIVLNVVFVAIACCLEE